MAEKKYYWRRKSSYLPNDLKNFSNIFRKDMSYDNIQNHKKSGLHNLYKNDIFQKPQWGQNDPVASCFSCFMNVCNQFLEHLV